MSVDWSIPADLSQSLFFLSLMSNQYGLNKVHRKLSDFDVSAWNYFKWIAINLRMAKRIVEWFYGQGYINIYIKTCVFFLKIGKENNLYRERCVQTIAVQTTKK